MVMEQRGAKIDPSDWEAVGDYLMTALLMTAEALGGQALVDKIAHYAPGEGPLPDPEALFVLERLYPGSAARVMDYAEELQQIDHGTDTVS